MLTRFRLLGGEGELEEFDSKIGKGKASRKPSIEDLVVGDPKSEDEQFKMMFLNMQRMLEELYNWRRNREMKHILQRIQGIQRTKRVKK